MPAALTKTSAMATQLNIAFASSNQEDLDEHFGSCHQFTIYSLSPQSAELLRNVQFTAQEEDSHSRQKINDRLKALQGCFAVYCLACGNPVRQQLMADNIRVVIQAQPTPITTLLAKIQDNWPGAIASRQQKAAQSTEPNKSERAKNRTSQSCHSANLMATFHNERVQQWMHWTKLRQRGSGLFRSNNHRSLERGVHPECN